jgi:retron-type reverse transcriptase
VKARKSEGPNDFIVTIISIGRVTTRGIKRKVGDSSRERKEVTRMKHGEFIKQILTPENLNQAYLQVKRNGGAAGVDGMTVDELVPYLKKHKNELVKSILNRTYRPQPVLRVEIPKPNGGVRLLGIPTVVDRVIQQAIAQVIGPEFNRDFHPNSYGFRPGRNAQMAIIKRS